MITLDQGIRQAEVLTDNLSAIAAQNQEANRNANLEVSSIEQLADSSLSEAQAQGQLNNFIRETTSSTTTTTSSSSAIALTLAAAQTSAAQQSTRTNSSGSCCCLLDSFEPEKLEVTLEDVEIRYGYDAFNEWESEIYAFVIGRVSINIPLASTFTLFMDFDGNSFEVTIPSPLKTGGDSPTSASTGSFASGPVLGQWFTLNADVDDPWPPPYQQVFARGTSLGQRYFCEQKVLSVTGYAVGYDPFNVFEQRVSEVQLPDSVVLTACPYIGTIGIQEAKNDVQVVATISVDNLPFILPLRVGVAYGDASWRSDAVVSGGSVSVNWVWEGFGPAPSTTPIILEVTIGTANYRYFNIYGSPTNDSSSVYWAWDVFSKQYQLQVILLDWRWNGKWEYVGPRWSNYYSTVTFWDEDYQPQPPVSGPPGVVFPEPEAVTATFTKSLDCYSTWIAYSVDGGYSLTELPPRGEGCGTDFPCIAVIDESSAYDSGALNADWSAFKQAWPRRPFFILRVNPPGTVEIPASYDGRVIDIGRNITEDWFALCGFENLAPNSGVIIWIDNSGSMTTADVQGSYSLFLFRCETASILVTEKEGDNEAYIAPFISGF
jgi:hypothetical protein